MQRPETGIKHGVGEVEPVHERLFGPFGPEKKKNRTIFSDAPLLQWRFSAGMTQKVEFHLLPQPDFSEILCKGQKTLVHKGPF